MRDLLPNDNHYEAHSAMPLKYSSASKVSHQREKSLSLTICYCKLLTSSACCIFPHSSKSYRGHHFIYHHLSSSANMIIVHEHPLHTYDVPFYTMLAMVRLCVQWDKTNLHSHFQTNNKSNLVIVFSSKLFSPARGLLFLLGLNQPDLAHELLTLGRSTIVDSPLTKKCHQP